MLDIEQWTKAMMAQFKGESEREMEKEAVVWFDLAQVGLRHRRRTLREEPQGWQDDRQPRPRG